MKELATFIFILIFVWLVSGEPTNAELINNKIRHYLQESAECLKP